MSAPVRPHLGGRLKPLWRNPALWITAVMLCVGAWRMAQLGYPSLVAYPRAAILTIVLFALYAVPFVMLVNGLDYLEPEPVTLTATAMAWGGLAATTVGISGGQVVQHLLSEVVSPTFSSVWSPALAGSTVEEFAKLLGIIMIVLLARGQINSVVDGVVYGAFVGLGFQLVEDYFYAMYAVQTAGNGDSVAPVIGTFLVRGFLSGLWSHTMFTALVGAGIGYALVAVNRSRKRRIGVAVLAFAVAWLLHFLWNSPLLVFGTGLGALVAVLLIKGLPGLLLLLGLVGEARRSEAAYYSAALARRADPGLATMSEIHTLCHARSRAAARRYAKARGGLKAGILVRRLQLAQAKLAVALSQARFSLPTSAYDITGRHLDILAMLDRRERDIRVLRGRLFGLGISEAAAPYELRRVSHWKGVALRTVFIIVGSIFLAVMIRRLGSG